MVNKVYFKDQIVVCVLSLWVFSYVHWTVKMSDSVKSSIHSDSHRELSRPSGWGRHSCLLPLCPLLAVLCTAGGAGWRQTRSLRLVTSIFRKKSLMDPDALTEAAGTSLKAEALSEFPLYLHSLSPCSKSEIGIVDWALEELISGGSLLMWFRSLGGHGFK